MQGQYRGDFTRNTFDPAKHFSRVMMQQGRVQLDADSNEQTAILLHYLRCFAADLIGPHGGPSPNGTSTTQGFFISRLMPDNVLVIGQGHYYINGVLCELVTPAVPISVSGSEPNLEITLQNAGLKGATFEKGQYVEIFDDGPNFDNAFFQITNTRGNYVTVSPTPSGTGSQKPSVTKYHTPKMRHAVTYDAQPDYPLPPDSANHTNFLLYLDVWERHITYLEDSSLREVALGGADTAARAKVVWQVKLSSEKLKIEQEVTSAVGEVSDAEWRAFVSNHLQSANRGLLKAHVAPQPVSTDPCTISSASAYRGFENQLYRVEINSVANNVGSRPTFKWSRENGSVIFPILELGTALGQTTVILGNLGRDERLSLTEGDWVEVQDDNSVLQNQPGTLLKVAAIDRTAMKVTLAGTTGGRVGTDRTKHPLLRRWDQKSGDPTTGGVPLEADGAVRIVEGHWIPLEYGIQIQFQSGGNYRTGDFWLIPARTATGEIQWPRTRKSQSAGQPEALPPLGVDHYYAPLAHISKERIIDLRRTFFGQAMANE
jgi:hypothetical protein